MTQYYRRIMNNCANEFYFNYQHFQVDSDSFMKKVCNENSCGVYSLNSKIADLDLIDNYVGSHIIRNPRDLIVSGYNYHLRTREKWCIDSSFNWVWLTNDPFFIKHIEPNKNHFPEKISYQDYLKTLHKDKGLVLEMIRTKPSINNMINWNYNQPKIMEMRYEKILGNEISTFSKLFEHYKLEEKVAIRALELTREYSLKKQIKKKDPHISHGGIEQWRNHFNSEHTRIFERMFTGCMNQLQYSSE